MSRVKRGVTSRAKHKKVLKAVKGQWGRGIEVDGTNLNKKENLNLFGYRELTLE